MGAVRGGNSPRFDQKTDKILIFYSNILVLVLY